MVAKTTVASNLLQTLEIFTELVVQAVGKYLRVLAVAAILLTIEEPVGNLILTGILDDGHKAFQLVIRKFTGTT